MKTALYCVVGVALLAALMLAAGCTPKTPDTDAVPPIEGAGLVGDAADNPEPTEATEATEESADDEATDEGGADASPVSRMMDSFDANEDGQLTEEEMPDGMWDHVARVDADGDGVLTPEEIKNLRMPGAIDSGHGGSMGESGGAHGMGGGGGAHGMGGAQPDMSKMRSGHDAPADSGDAEPTTE